MGSRRQSGPGEEGPSVTAAYAVNHVTYDAIAWSRDGYIDFSGYGWLGPGSDPNWPPRW